MTNKRDYDIRSSLHYQTYVEHAESLKIAADENLKLFLDTTDKWFKQDNGRVRSLGLLRATLLLYAVSVELILKARALNIEKENIKQGKLKTFQDFLQKWKGKSNGHDFYKIIDYYKLDLTIDDRDLLDNLISFTTWAGRYPFPKKENEILKIENGESMKGVLKQNYNLRLEGFINRQITSMTY